jgi:hypothetical protein
MRPFNVSFLPMLLAALAAVTASAVAGQKATRVRADVLAAVEEELARFQKQAEKEAGPAHPRPSSEAAFLLLTGLAAQGSQITQPAAAELRELGITPASKANVQVFAVAEDARIVISAVALQDRSGYWTSKRAALFRRLGEKWVERGSGSTAIDGVTAERTERKPTTIVIRSVLPPDLKDAKDRRSFGAQYGLTHKDFDRCKLLVGIKHMAPLRIISQAVQHGQKACETRLVATTEDYAKVGGFKMAAGRFLKDEDDRLGEDGEERFRNVIVVGARVAEALFPSEDAKQVVGKTIVLNKQDYVVVGVINKRAPERFLDQPEDFNKDVYVSITALRSRFGERIYIRRSDQRTAQQVELDQIIMTVAEPERAQPLAEATRELLKKHHQKQDWEVMVR